MVLYLNKNESHSPKDALCQVWLKLAQWFWRRFFHFVNVFSVFRNYLPLEKGRALHLNKTQSPSPKDALCQVWLKLALWFWRRRFFLISSMYFGYFINISPWKRAWPFIWTKLNPLHPRMLCAKFGWNWLSGSGEEGENVKSLWRQQRQRRQPQRRTTDKFWSEKLPWAFGSGELKMCN